MTTLTVIIDDQRAAILRRRAQDAGLDVEELVAASLRELLDKEDDQFAEAVADVLDRNAELYKRLA
jgi:hypothetical protein